MLRKLLLLSALLLPGVWAADAASPLAGGMTRHGPDLAPEKCPFADGRVHIEWEPTDSNHIALNFEQAPKLERFGTLRVKMVAMADEETPLHHIGLRLQDATGEIFQYGKGVRLHPSGRMEIEWVITADTKAGVWGGNNDKKFDFPLKISGFSADYRQDAPRAFLDVTSFTYAVEDAVAAPAPAPARRVNLAAGVRRFLPGVKDSVKIDGGGKGVSVPLDLKEAKYAEIVFAEPLKLDGFSRMLVTARLAANDDCPVHSVNLRLRDANDETFHCVFKTDFAAAMGSELVAKWEVTPGECKNSWGGDGNHTLDFPVRVFGFSVDYPQDKAPKTVLEIREVKVEAK